ncbi:hypothetical protein [Cyanobium sp. NIES-981]|uniref:hypothetical protein n=1 Tax=Cyanobium sp. NIES-981 TaxID=1851505 RepID=UPI00156100A0|nr:hypothetical protein [Cyanobium sp. NIES-981]
MASLYLTGRIILKGKAILSAKQSLLAKDFKTRLITGGLNVRANNRSGSLLLGLDDLQVPFSPAVRLNKQIIANPVAAASFIDTSGVQFNPSGPLAPLAGALLAGGSIPPMLPPLA